MLVLKRNIGERIVISDGLITIEVIDFGPSWVRLGIDAPDNVRIDREEVHARRRAAFRKPKPDSEGA